MTVRDPLPLKPVIEDSSLTPGACRIILYVWSLGEGEHEIPHARFAKSKQAIPRETVRAVFLAARDTDATYAEIGEKYDIAPATAGRIANGKRVRYRRLTRDLREDG